MQNLAFQNYNRRDLPKLVEFHKNYLKKYPDAKLNDPEFYTYHPAFEDGENLFCVLNSARQMVGFAPLFPVVTIDDNSVIGPHDIWTVILAKPDLETADDIRGLLLRGVIEKVKKLKAVYGLSKVRLAADMMVSQEADIEYLVLKGFKPFEQVYVMGRQTIQLIPVISVPMEITLRPLKIVSEEEQMTYREVFNTCFPENPKTEEALRFFLESPLWQTGAVIGAYSPSDELVGSILVYLDEQRGCGVTDDVMVLPDWRGKNIAKRLIGEGLRYFQAKGIYEVRLEVKASNVPAVSVYRSMGYRIINRESLLGKSV